MSNRIPNMYDLNESYDIEANNPIAPLELNFFFTTEYKSRQSKIERM